MSAMAPETSSLAASSLALLDSDDLADGASSACAHQCAAPAITPLAPSDLSLPPDGGANSVDIAPRKTVPPGTSKRSPFYCPDVLRACPVESGDVPPCSGFVQLRYRATVPRSALSTMSNGSLAISVPLGVLSALLPGNDLKALARRHGLRPGRSPVAVVADTLAGHECSTACPPEDVCFFDVVVRRCYHVPVPDVKALRPECPARSKSTLCPGVLRHYPVVRGDVPACSGSLQLHYCGTVPRSALPSALEGSVALCIPLKALSRLLGLVDLHSLAERHGIRHSRMQLTAVADALARHRCSSQCPPDDVSLFDVVHRHCYHDPSSVRQSVAPPAAVRFPPIPPSKRALAGIVSEFCAGLSPQSVEEGPCGICGTLNNEQSMVDLDPQAADLSCLDRTGCGVTRRECSSTSKDGVPSELPGPVLCDQGIKFKDGEMRIRACPACARAIARRQLPTRALANGLWLGEIPQCLKDLNFVEKLAVSRYRHNMCVVKVDRGQRKLSANAVVFAQPTAKFYHVLPPHPDDMGDCLVLMFTGSTTPTWDEFKRTPLTFRRSVVLEALRWLKDNHSHYRDLQISMENLNMYKDNEPPVAIVHRKRSEDGAPAESLAVYENADERGTEDGPCPLTVHGLSSSEYATLSNEARVAVAMKHLREGGAVLAYGRSSAPESIYKNTRLFPGMFPWLYPYGLGGFENDRRLKRFDRAAHVRWKLMYHDRRFQEDEYFIFVVFNQQQIRDATNAGFLMTQRQRFDEVAQKLMSIDSDALQAIVDRGKDGSYVKPETDAEKACFDVIKMLDNIAGHVDGSVTKRKYLRNEIKSLMYQENVPLFFITFAPVDFKHPVCLYFCGEKIQLDSFAPVLPAYQDRMCAIAHNPIACARFFDLIVRLFLEHVLCYGKDKDGLFGPVNAYYGTVESQGRLTLHLHLLVWIKHSLSPQQIRQRILDGDEIFKSEIKEWLEHCHQGEFSTGSMDQIRARIQLCKESFAQSAGIQYTEEDEGDHSSCTGWRDPTTCLPEPPKDLTDDASVEVWFDQVARVVDEIVYLSNMHSPQHNKGCRRGPDGYCRARFPREIREETIFDPETGAIRMRKGEKWINTFSIVVSYLLRCNTDVTSLLSGTQVKAVLAYVSDYITKHSLKTHVMFETIKAVLDRKTEFISDDMATHERARVVLTKIVNGLTAKLEIGNPMVALFLLGLSDYYTSHQFKSFFWWSYRHEVERAWNGAACSDPSDDKLVLTPGEQGEVVGVSRVHDYVHRPPEFAKYSLYDYLRETDVRSLPKKERNRHRPLEEAPSSGNDEGDGDDGDADHEDADDRDVDDDADEEEMEGVTEPAPVPVAVGPIYRFLPQHPRYGTRGVVKVADENKWVLNFFGGSIPRRDRGDREEYCRTMLTFFVPWRSGRDLKLEEEDWETAFQRHDEVMQPHHKRIMDNFHVLFECHDARDDFAAQRRAARRDLDGFPVAAEELEASRDQSERAFVDSDLMDMLCAEEDDIGKATRARLQRVDMMRELLTETGWARPLPHVPAQDPGLDFIDGDGHTPAEWKQLVAAEKQKVIDAKMAACAVPDGHQEDIPWLATPRPDAYDVKVVRAEDLAAHNGTHRASLLSIEQEAEIVCRDYTLNYEQTRAYRMITKQLINRPPKALLMYLGGVGGTGKSRVLNACMDLLNRRRQSHRFAVTAPTGSAACLIDGTTYQSLLGMGSDMDGENMSEARLAKVRSRLVHVDILFIDEVSMISCSALYNISAQMCKALNVPDLPFGGKSVVFAGDFAQLPPPGGYPLYSSSVSVVYDASSRYAQTASIGKALWHLVTKAVILRQNMRMSGMTDRDRRFAAVLEKMRYGDCKVDDVAFLMTRLQGPGDRQPKLSDPRFRDVSIITAFNAERDLINEIGTDRFAKDSGQKLQTFCSVDGLGPAREKTSLRDMQRDSQAVPPAITDRLQKQLWSLPPSVTDHHAGSLSLCVNMPVLLKQNEATELCATNGAEGRVSGWKSSSRGDGVQVLETIFVRLTNPPRPMRIPDLPPNVVPINRTRKRVRCRLPSDRMITITREQVSILPNFAMTDFCSQGRTRPNNVVDLSQCRNHQSIYTCLSRSSSFDGTLIVRGFDASKICDGIDKGLRQEQREFEIIDQICEWEEQGYLPDDFPSSTRAAVVGEFYKRWGTKFIPPKVHPALRWDNEKDVSAPPVPDKWRILTRSKKRKAGQAADASSPVDNKRSRGEDGAPNASSQLVPSANNRRASLTLGIAWDKTDWSCAYDCFLMVLWSACDQCPDLGDQVKARYGAFAVKAIDMYDSLRQGQCTPEQGRDKFRDAAFEAYPTLYPRYGPRGASVSDLAIHTFESDVQIGVRQKRCPSCSTVYSERPLTDGLWTFKDHRQDVRPGEYISTSAMFTALFTCPDQRRACDICLLPLSKEMRMHTAPPLLAIDFSRDLDVSIDYEVHAFVGDTLRRWRLAGIVYLGGNHFTAAVFDDSRRCFYYDGMFPETVRPTESPIADSNLNTMHARRACLVIYVLG